jgi:FtsZ-interacting cell division protein ZipA
MGNELRWILLGVGLLIVVGLWWFERRRPGVPAEESSPRASDRVELTLDGGEDPRRSELARRESRREPVIAEDSTPFEAVNRPFEPRAVPGNDPPIVTIDGLPENVDEVMLTSGPAEPARMGAFDPEVPPLVALDADVETLMEKALFETPVTPKAQPAQPEVSKPEVPSGNPPTPAPARTAMPSQAATPIAEEELPAPVSPQQQRIAAMRLLTPPDRPIPGAELKAALQDEGLEYGRYSIFHQMVSGKPLFSIASLVEPGIFRPDQMPGQEFPGVSFFAIFPGPRPAPQAFEEMLAVARRLADRWDAVLQDETGSSLTAQRVSSIREDLVHFEHLASLSRPRGG